MTKIAAALLLLVMASGCIQKIDDLEFVILKPGFALPIGSVRINASSLTQIGDSLSVREGQDNVIEFYYEDELERVSLTDRFSINNQSFSDDLPFSSFIFIAGKTNEVTAFQHDSFTLSNIDNNVQSPDLTKIIFKGGVIDLVQRKDFDHSVETTISFPKLTKSGTPYTIVITNQGNFSEPLVGYELDLTGISGTESNTIEYEITTTISNTGTDSNGTLSFDVGFTAIEFSYIEGDFHTYDFDEIEQETSLGLPESEFPDNVGFTNPSLELIVDNSAGISFGVDISEFSFSDSEGVKQQVTGSYDDATLVVEMPMVAGTSEQSIFSISNQNTDNLIDLISQIPESVLVSANVSANPFSDGTIPNFITDSSSIVMKYSISIPMEGYANNYAFVDTIRDVNLVFDEDGVISLDEINLRLKVENNFPFELRLQLYFMDSTLTEPILDSLFATVDDQRLFPSGNVDANGLVQSAEIRTNDITITNAKYETIKGATSIKFAAYLLTPGANENPRKSVKFTTDNYLSLGIGITADVLIDPNQIDLSSGSN